MTLGPRYSRVSVYPDETLISFNIIEGRRLHLVRSFVAAGNAEYMIRDDLGEDLGRIVFTRRGDRWEVLLSLIDFSLRSTRLVRRRVGRWLYVEAINDMLKAGRTPVCSDTSRNAESDRVWESITRANPHVQRDTTLETGCPLRYIVHRPVRRRAVKVSAHIRRRQE